MFFLIIYDFYGSHLTKQFIFQDFDDAFSLN